LGGRSAEKIIYGNVSTGASDDIEKVSTLITNYTNSWGMNETIGPLNPDMMGNIGKQITDDIMTNCKYIIRDIENQTIKILKKYKQHMETIAKDLLENETIEYNKIKNLISNKRLENSKEIILTVAHPREVTH
jgi:cell division protease FtsH